MKKIFILLLLFSCSTKENASETDQDVFESDEVEETYAPEDELGEAILTIKGKDITIDGSGKINAKAGGDIVMKGSKILQN